MYIRKITSNIKSGVDVELHPKTLIVGPNGSGKSSIINAIELALTQSVNDLRGKKSVKRGSDLITLAPGDEDLKCVADYDNGKSTSVTIERTPNGAGRPKVKNKLKGKLPFNDVLTVLTSKPTVLKEWVVENVGNVVSRAAIIDMLGEELAETYNRLAGTSKNDEIEILKMVTIKNQDKIKAYREEIRSTQKALEKLEENIQIVDESHLVSLSKKAEESFQLLNGLISSARAIEETHKRKASLGERLAQHMQELNDYKKKLDIATTSSNLSQPVTEQDEFLVALREKLLNMAKIHLALNMSDCMLCTKGNSVNFGERIQSLDGMNQSVVEALDAHNQRIGLEKEVKRLQTTVDNLVNEIKTCDHNLDLHGGGFIQEDIANAKIEWETTTQRVQDIKNQKVQLVQIHEMKANIVKFEDMISTAKKLSNAIQIVNENLASSSASSFVSSVQQFLPNDYKFSVKISDSVEIGFEKEGVIHQALSGAEWASMIMAMSAACADSTQFNIITPEERAFDPNTLYNVMGVLSACPYQVILTSTTQPSSDVEGWNIISLE